QLQAIISAVVAAALQEQKEDFEVKLKQATDQFRAVALSVPEVVVYEPVKIVAGVECNEGLDAVKSLPDFFGSEEEYVSWRQAALATYDTFRPYDGSSRHHQAVLIIRNRVKGAANRALSSFNTVLNFDAIISRLDFTYSDKRPLYLLERELSTLRKGPMSIVQFYEEVEKKLTFIINKTTMTHEPFQASLMNDTHRANALRVFISGLKKNLTDILFATQPKNSPSALALVQELESNLERYAFASQYARSVEDKGYRHTQQQWRQGWPDQQTRHGGKSQFFTRERAPRQVSTAARDLVEKMDVDPSSSKYRQPTNFQQPQSQQSLAQCYLNI
ncbi:hypothetical protein KR044_010368, partial [Drosophila immigrans]